MVNMKKNGSEELVFDYKMFDVISKDLAKHHKRIVSIRKNIAQNRKVSVMTKSGLIESLGNIIEHMKNAQHEIDTAKKELKMI